MQLYAVLIITMAKTMKRFSTLKLIAGTLFVSYCLRYCTAGGYATLSDMMWDSTETERTRVTNSAFIRNIGVGILDPTEFGLFNVQDAVYCNMTSETLGIAASRATDQELKAVLEAESDAFRGFGEEGSATWHILDIASIRLDDSVAKYIAIERNISETMEPIYSLVALTPTVRLWPWIGTQIDFTKCGVYQSWIEVFFGPSKHYESLENIIDKWYINETLDRDRAMEIYKTFMGLEAAVFEESATLQNTSTPTTPECTINRTSVPCGSVIIIVGQIVCLYIWLTIQTNPGGQL